MKVNFPVLSDGDFSAIFVKKMMKSIFAQELNIRESNLNAYRIESLGKPRLSEIT
jgi:hypothetical protein